MLENSEGKRREKKEETKDRRVNEDKTEEQTKTTVGVYWDIIIMGFDTSSSVGKNDILWVGLYDLHL